MTLPAGSASSRPSTPWLVVLAAALPAALHAVLLLGRLHPDEVFQSLEPAMVRAFGYGIQAWEWSVGLRNHAVPIFFAWMLEGAAAVGLDDVWWRRAWLEVPQLALHAAMLGAAWRYAARRVGGRLAHWSLWLVALYAPLVWFGGRTMSESFSVAFLVLGLERLDADGEDGSPVAWLLGGLFLGLSVVTRYGTAAAVAPAMLWLLVSRRFRPFGYATGAGLVVAGLLGALDRFTWGEWFHSFRLYVDFNVLTRHAAERFGTEPPWFYLVLLLPAPWAVVGLGTWWVERAGRGWLLFVSGLGYLLVITATAHKEARFLYPTLILWTVAGTPAFVSWLAARWERRWARPLLAATLLGGLAFFVVDSPWAPEREAQFQLEAKASRGATGLVMMNEGVWGSGAISTWGRTSPSVPAIFPRSRASSRRRGTGESTGGSTGATAMIHSEID